MISNNILQDVIVKDKFNRENNKKQKITVNDELKVMNKIRKDKYPKKSVSVSK